MKIRNTILKKLHLKKTTTIYLDLAVVVPRKDVKRHFELFVPQNFDHKLNELLKNLLPFQKLSEAVNVKDDSLVLDVAVSDYQTGSDWWFDFSRYFLLLFWRPKVQLRARMYNYSSKNNIAEFEITKYLPWKYVLNRLLSYENKYQIGSEDTQVLLYKAIEELKIGIDKVFL